MAADGESTGKSKGRAGRQDEAGIDERAGQAEHLDANELETIPTMVPRRRRLSIAGQWICRTGARTYRRIGSRLNRR